MKLNYFLMLLLLSLTAFSQTTVDQSQKIVDPNRIASDNFGSDVSISGNYLIVGAQNDDFDADNANELSGAGAAFIFERANSSSSWTFIQKIVNPDRAASDGFGSKVSITERGYLVVAASGEDEDENGANFFTSAGSAYVWERDDASGTWTYIQKIVSQDRSTAEQFGADVHVKGDLIVVGVRYDTQDENSAGSVSQAGSANIFHRESVSGTWTRVQKVLANDRSSGDQFGTTVDFDGEKLIVGATEEDHDPNGNVTLSSAGAAYIYSYDSSSNTFAFEQKITASDRAASDDFGFRVAINSDYAAVGAHYHGYDENGANFLSEAGAVYIFQ